MITNSKGTINLQSALDRLVSMGKEDPNILVEYAQNPPASLGSNAGLLVNMAANMVGDQRQRAQAEQQGQQGQQPTVMEQGIAKLAPQQPQMMPPQQMPPEMMAQAPQMPPQMMAQAPMAPPQMMAEGGLAQLDVGDMYNENNFATGGIVAFDEGGDVGMNLDELPSLNINIIGKPSKEDSGNSFGTQNILGDMGRMGPTGIGIQGGINPRPWYEQMSGMIQGMAPAQPKSYALNVNSGKQEAQYAQGGEVQHYDGREGSYVEGREYPNYAVEEEPTSFFDRTIGRYMDREKEMMLADDALEKYKLEKGVMPWTKQTKAERDAYDKGLSELKQKRKEAGKSIFSFTTPTVGVTADKYVPPKEDTTNNLKKQTERDKANENALKKSNDDYLKTLKQTNADQISSYDQSMQRVMDLAKNDPYRDQLRAEYEKEKSGAFYDVLGDIGASLAGAKKGQEGQALQQGFTAATSRVKDLRKQKRDLMLAEQKADRDYQMLGAKYGFDSEQARAALAAKERMAEAENKVRLESANIMSGGKQRALDLKATQNYNKAWAEWTKGPEGMNLMLAANRKPNGDKQHDAEIVAAKQKIESERRRIMLENGMSGQSSSTQLPAGMTMESFNTLMSKYSS